MSGALWVALGISSLVGGWCVGGRFTASDARRLVRRLRAVLGSRIRGAKVADPRPCRGANANVCVAEGCYGEACVRGRAPDEETQ